MVVADHVLGALGVDVPVLEIELPGLVDALHRLLEVSSVLENPSSRLSHLHNSWGVRDSLTNKLERLCSVALEVIQLCEEVKRPQEGGWGILLGICCKVVKCVGHKWKKGRKRKKKEKEHRPESFIF